MIYQGGKGRNARAIAAVIAAQDVGRTACYVEPFVGGAAVACELAPVFDRAILSDANVDLIDLWRAVQQGWLPEPTLTQEQYAELKAAPPSPARTFAGTACSWGGKWWGGYARGTGGGREGYAAQQRRTLARQAPAVRGVELQAGDYRTLDIPPCATIYCDPPYAGTTGYAATGAFDTAAFHAWCRQQVARGCEVYVSEYDAPQDWPVLWEQAVSLNLAGGGRSAARTERLYAVTP